MIAEARSALYMRLLKCVGLKKVPYTTKWQIASADIPCAYIRFGSIATTLSALGYQEVKLTTIVDVLTEYRGQNELPAVIVKTENILDSVLEQLASDQFLENTDFHIDMGEGIRVSGISELPYGESCWGVTFQFTLVFPKNIGCGE